VLLGSMNNPALPLDQELERIGAAGFDFVDLTLEPPGAWPAAGSAIERRVRELGLSVVGHTAYFLPLASPYPELRAQAADLFERALDVLAEAGATRVNVHPDPLTRPAQDAVAHNVEALGRLAAHAASAGVTLMLENLGGSFARADELRPILDAVDELAFHLDVGHAHMAQRAGEPNRAGEFLDAFGSRLAHVHVHDNFGADDLHLPLGVGSVEWPFVVRALKRVGYDGTVTLEVFAEERSYLDLSRRLWLEWWEDPEI
jgi:sugar phosphate isomerase/epimerase